MNVRLSEFEINAIKSTAYEIFGKNSKIILFGSRANPNKKGGDIDLLIIPEKKDNLFEKKIKFLARTKMKIGEQKIDLILYKDGRSEIEKEALKNGVELL